METRAEGARSPMGAILGSLAGCPAGIPSRISMAAITVVSRRYTQRKPWEPAACRGSQREPAGSPAVSDGCPRAPVEIRVDGCGSP